MDFEDDDRATFRILLVLAFVAGSFVFLWSTT